MSNNSDEIFQCITKIFGVELNIAVLYQDVIPLYPKDNRQTNPSSAYVEITHDGQVTAGINLEIEAPVNNDIKHGKTRRIPCPSNVIGSELANFLKSKSGLNLLQRIHVGHEVKLSNNHLTGALSQDAKAAELELSQALKKLPAVDIESYFKWLDSLESGGSPFFNLPGTKKMLCRDDTALFLKS